MTSASPPIEEKKEGKKVGAFRAPQENFTSKQFVYGKLLGLGSYSKVVRVKKKDTGQEYALKVMDKRHIIREKKVPYVKMERLILDQLDHPGVTRLHFTFQDSLYLYMGMECCNGGELFDQIKRKGQLSLEDTRFYVAEIVETLEYIHSEGLIHRDLKPENILFTSDGHVKIADFGSAKTLRSFTNGIITCDPDEKSCTFVGTAEYVAPEVLNSQPVTPSVDMWALGCVIFQMLDGKPPFKAASEYLTFQKVMSRDFTMPQQFPPEAKDLIGKLLNLVPEKRPGLAAIKKHPFFTGVSWGNLWKMPAPSLALSSDQSGDDWNVAQLQAGLEAFELSESSDSGSASNSQSSSPKASLSRDFSRSPSRKSISSPSAGGSENHTLSEDCSLEQWQRFLHPGEKLLGTSLVRKYSGMVTKRQQLLLTSKPRLAIVDLKKLILDEEITWSNNPHELYVEIEDHLRFSVHTLGYLAPLSLPSGRSVGLKIYPIWSDMGPPKLIWHFEDLRGLARDWRSAIEKLQNERLSSLQEQLVKEEDSRSQKEPAELPHITIQTDCAGLPLAAGQTPFKLQAKPLPVDSPFDIQEHLCSNKQPGVNQDCHRNMREANPRALPLEDGEKLREALLDSSRTAENKIVQSNEDHINSDLAVVSVAEQETSVYGKYECPPVLADNERSVCYGDRFEALPVSKKILAIDHYVSEPGLVGNENPEAARADQLKQIVEQIL